MDELLRQPAAEGARTLLLRYSDEAEQAYRRIERRADAEALHDLRVALRRLRSTERAFRNALQPRVTRELRNAIRDFARSTGESRDLEVQIEWVASQKLRAEKLRRGQRWLLRTLRARKRTLDAEGAERQRAFPRIHAALLEALDGENLSHDVNDAAPSFASALAAQLRAALSRLHVRLAAVHTIEDQARAHEARIAGKRLRYLLEPVSQLRGVKPLLLRLRKLQDAVGDMRDANLLRTEIHRALALQSLYAHHTMRAGVAHSAAPRAARDGLEELARRLRAAESGAYRRLRLSWLTPRVDSFTQGVRDVTSRLAVMYPRGSAGVEVERKYLLSSLPELANTVRPLEIEQGWLPGKLLAERLRRTTQNGNNAYYRTIKLGRGVRRREIEETTTREVFDAMWPLTAGKRVTKRRYRISAGALLWEIDEFTDRDLVLAEVELSDEADPVEIPQWLQPYMIREVTDEPEYVNMNLAM